MLNEFLEFKAYVTDPKSEKPRVTPLMLTDRFKESDKKTPLLGIEEIMTVIARAYIYSGNQKVYVKPGQINSRVIKNTIELLHRWTGFSNEGVRKKTNSKKLDQWMLDNSVVEGWLKDYWMFWFEEKVIKSKLKNVNDKEKAEKLKAELLIEKEKRWKKLENGWNEDLNSTMDYQARKITYNNIIANALEKGPLRNRYFAFRKSPEQIGKKVKKGERAEKERFNYLINVPGMQGDTKMKILKAIAAYLIILECHPEGQKEAWIKNSDLSRWDAYDEGNNGPGTWYPPDVLWNEKPIYTRQEERNKCSKMQVNPEYLKEFDFRIIDMEDADKYKYTHWVLEDLGHGVKNCWGIKI